MREGSVGGGRLRRSCESYWQGWNREYALRHPELRHRELAWRMVDEEVVYLSPSTVYRILKSENLVCPWRRRTKRRREEEEKANRPNEVWATDLKYVAVGDRNYYLVCFLTKPWRGKT